MMRLLKSSVHPLIKQHLANKLTRLASRAIILKGEDILLLYTKRYHDFSLPGGGIEANETHHDGLIRELKEETGARNITNIEPFGLYEEFRPSHKPEFDTIHIKSYCYTCVVDDLFDKPSFEPHEINNGMSPMWINIHQAIAHNEKTIAESTNKGLSVDRETFLLKLIVTELLK
jgi:8-oxo-dGTP pyrophosphatase MutT (NUDIX family)